MLGGNGILLDYRVVRQMASLEAIHLRGHRDHTGRHRRPWHRRHERLTSRSGVEGLKGLTGRVKVGILTQGLADAVTVEFPPHRVEDGAER
jgi:hypothetical protein